VTYAKAPGKGNPDIVVTSEFEKVIKEANKFAKHAKRKTIMEEDILLAIEKIK